MNNKNLQFIQEQLEYDFIELNLLRQAFTRKSYSEEHNGTYHNEVLEFYGDKALEIIVMKKLSEYFGEKTQNGKYRSSKTEGELTEIKKKLVCKKMLSSRIDFFGFEKFLLMGKGDISQNAQNQESVKEDLFESIIGAVAIDSRWDFEEIENVVDKLLDVEYFLENGFQNEGNYVDLIQTWHQKKFGELPVYDYVEDEDGYECSLMLYEDEAPFEGYRYSKRDARMDAAKKAYEYLEEENELVLPIDEVGEPNIDRAINQLQELYQKGYIGEPWYDFKESYDENGNPVWRCECHVEGRETYWWREHSSKKQGKKLVAYSMLCEILCVEE